MGLIASTTAPRPPSVEAWQFAGLWDFSRWAVRRNDASETPVGDRKVAAPSYLQFPISQNPPQEDFSSWHFPVCQLPASWVKHDTTPGHQGAPGSLGKLQQPWMRTHRRPKTRWLPAASEKSGCKQETVEGPPLTFLMSGQRCSRADLQRHLQSQEIPSGPHALHELGIDIESHFA